MCIRDRHSSYYYDIVVDGSDKIIIPPKLRKPAVEWYHNFLCHPGQTRLELTLRQHYDWRGLRTDVVRTCNACVRCKERKKKNSRLGKLPPKEAEYIPWHTLCIDLIGPYALGKKEKECSLWCLTMIDPATGWFEIVEIDTKRADNISNELEFHCLT